MPILDPTDEKKLPSRPTATTFCDHCHKLTTCTQYRRRAGRIEWLCDASCQPKPYELMREIVRNSPPPPDAAPSPLLDQWLEPRPPADLDVDIPDELHNLAIDQAIAAEDARRESDPIAAERGTGADELTHADAEAS